MTVSKKRASIVNGIWEHKPTQIVQWLREWSALGLQTVSKSLTRRLNGIALGRSLDTPQRYYAKRASLSCSLSLCRQSPRTAMCDFLCFFVVLMRVPMFIFRIRTIS